MAKKQKNNSRKTVGKKNPVPKSKPFTKGDARINRNGRPRILLSEFNAELIKAGVEPVTPSQIDQSYKLFFNMTVEEIKAVANDEKKGILLRQTAKSLLSNAGQKMLEDMMNRSMGMAKQISEGTVKVFEHKLPDMTGWSYAQTLKFLENGELPTIHTSASPEAGKD